jgi:hypothetical protein
MKRGIKTMADRNPADLLARKDDIRAGYDQVRAKNKDFTDRRANMVRDALISSGALSAAPDRVISFRVETDIFGRRDGSEDPNWEFSIKFAASDFRIKINLQTGTITEFNTSGISSRIRGPEDANDVEDAAEYYLAVAELLANGKLVADAARAIKEQLDPENTALDQERDAAYGDFYALERAEREAEQARHAAALTASAAPGMMWITHDKSNRWYSESAAYYAVRVDKVTNTAADLTAFGYIGSEYRSKEPTIMAGNTKRLYKKDVAPAKLLAQYYTNTGLTEAEFNAKFKADPKAFIIANWSLRE